MRIIKDTYHVRVADMLRDFIMTGKLNEGDKIDEGALCKRLGISKTPLREALRVLSVEGLMRQVPHRGSFVTKPTFEEIGGDVRRDEPAGGFLCARSLRKSDVQRFFAA